MAGTVYAALKRQSLFDEELPRENPPVGMVKAARIRFAPGQPTGLHRHGMSTVGVVTVGRFRFQPESGESRILQTGDSFFEPAGRTILHFDNASATEDAEIVCFYLTDAADRPPIEMLPGGLDAQIGKDRPERTAAPAVVEHPSPAPITGHETEPTTEMSGALAEFYRAFNNRDLKLMEQNWESSAEAVMDNPLGGIMRGWPAIRSVYGRLFTGKARVTVEFFDYTLHQAGDAFWAIGRERGSLKTEGRPDLPLLIRTSRLFRRSGRDGRWHQIHHHGSIDDAKLLAAYQAQVREAAESS